MGRACSALHALRAEDLYWLTRVPVYCIPYSRSDSVNAECNSASYTDSYYDDFWPVVILCIGMQGAIDPIGELFMSQSAFRIAISQEQVHEIMRCLHQAGIATDSISVLYMDGVVPEQGHGDLKACREEVPAPSKIGRLVSETQEWTIGLVAMKIPGLGSLIATGPIMGVLANIPPACGPAGLATVLVENDIPKHQADYYVQRIMTGGVLVSVATDSAPGRHKAWRIFKHSGAEEVADTRGRWKDDSTTELRAPNASRGRFSQRSEITWNRQPLRQDPSNTKDGA